TVDFLSDDFFSVESPNANREKFDKVSRIVAQSEKHGMLMHLDVNTEIHPMKKGDRFLMVLSSSHLIVMEHLLRATRSG
ncbi:RNA polymerase, Rpb, partial [Parasponia andersonii]